MLGENVITTTQTVDIIMERSRKKEAYCEHLRHCKLQRYGVGLRGMAQKDVARHQSGATSHYKERCSEPLLDVILLQQFQARMPLPRSHVKRVSQVRGSRGLVSESGHLSPCLPHCPLG